MRTRRHVAVLGVAALALGAWAAAPAATQQVRVIDDDEWCEDGGWGDGERHCEVREATLAPTALWVDAGNNGGVGVTGGDRGDVLVRAKVTAQARDIERAREIASEVEVSLGGGRIGATGPDTGSREGWWVSFRLEVPRSTDIAMEAHNGGISVEGVAGRIRFETRNGGVKLADVAGDVRGETRNGGVGVHLTGTTWQGDGLSVTTRNGGVTIVVPDGYNAHLETATRNGGMTIGFPVTLQGEIGRSLSVDLGSGGPTIHVVTTNGGVRVRRPED